jgi:hypothetical protein
MLEKSATGSRFPEPFGLQKMARKLSLQSVGIIKLLVEHVGWRQIFPKPSVGLGMDAFGAANDVRNLVIQLRADLPSA